MRRIKRVGLLDQQPAPTRFVAIHCQGCFPAQPSRPDVRQERLAGVSLARWLSLSGRRIDQPPVQLERAADFWSKITEWTRGLTELVLVARGLPRVWNLLRLWEQIEDGVLVVGPAGQGQEGREHPPGGKRFHGYLITGSPPTGGVTKWLPSGCNLIWTDVLNYGVKLEPAAEDPTAAIDQFGGWFCRFLLTLATDKLGGLQLTAASQALATYRTRFLPTIIEPTQDSGALSHERQALYGGRCQLFYYGDVGQPPPTVQLPPLQMELASDRHEQGPVHHFDTNGLYAAVMADGEFPCRHLKTLVEPAVADLLALPKHTTAIARVTACCLATELPARTEVGVCFPEGRFHTILADKELQLALQRGQIEKIHWAEVYQTADLFSHYVRFCWGRRQDARRDGDPAGGAVWKLLLNSLAGRFAQRGSRWVDRPEITTTVPWGSFWFQNDPTERPRYCRSIAWRAQERVPQGEAALSFPAITACIQAQARVRLAAWLGIAGEREVYYVDTDSLFTSSWGAAQLTAARVVNQDRLGCLRLVATYPWVRFAGLKNYWTGERRVRAGLPTDGVQLHAGKGYWFQPATLEQSLAQPPQGRQLWQRRCCPLTSPFRHGTITKNGWVKPVQL